MPNGLRLRYYIDTPTAQIDAMDYDLATGAVASRRPLVTGFDFGTTGFPDGRLGGVYKVQVGGWRPQRVGMRLRHVRCAIDEEDRLWVARFNGGCCGCYDLSGKLLAEVRVPAEAGLQAPWPIKTFVATLVDPDIEGDVMAGR